MRTPNVDKTDMSYMHMHEKNCKVRQYVPVV